MADKFELQVTAGPDYSADSQHPVPVNAEKPISVTTSQADSSITIRVQNFRGVAKDSPSTSPYFSNDAHKKDLYSLQFSFVPKSDINGHDLVLGNDFDHSIRDRLPPGFDQALKIVQWFIDPGLYGDVRADEPHMFGPLLSSVNTFRVDGTNAAAPQAQSGEAGVHVVEEGALQQTDGDGQAIRDEFKIPSTAAGRRKHFLTAANLKDFIFRKDVRYTCDFFNPYLDFNGFALKLPGFGIIPGITIPIISYWDGQPLRYVLKNRSTGEKLFVIVFTLIPKSKEDEKDKSPSSEEVKGQDEQKGKTKEEQGKGGADNATGKSQELAAARTARKADKDNDNEDGDDGGVD